MATGKGLVATLSLAALIGGGVYMSTGSHREAPAPVLAGTSNATGTAQAGGSPPMAPVIEIIRPERGPNAARATTIPRLESEPAREEVFGHLGETLRRGRMATVPPNVTLSVHGLGARLEQFEFLDWNLATSPEPARLAAMVRPVGEAGGAWTVTFGAPLRGSLLVAVYHRAINDPDPDNQRYWLATVEDGPAPNPAVVAQVEASARARLAQRAAQAADPAFNVARARNLMRSVASGLEAYRLDWKAYPPSVPAGDPRSVNAADPLMSQMPGFLSTALTTPASYSASLGMDPFAARRRTTFAFEGFAPDDPRQSLFGDWVLLSPGPDRDWDCQFLNAPDGLPADAASRVVNATYDPTNGATSSGDLMLSPNAGQPR